MDGENEVPQHGEAFLFYLANLEDQELSAAVIYVWQSIARRWRRILQVAEQGSRA